MEGAINAVLDESKSRRDWVRGQDVSVMLWRMARSKARPLKSTSNGLASIATSMSGLSALNRSRCGTSQAAANEGSTLTVTICRAGRSMISPISLKE